MKTAFFCLLTLLLGLSLGLMINIQVMGDLLFSSHKQETLPLTAQQGAEVPNNSERVNLNATAKTPTPVELLTELDGSNAILLIRTYQVLGALRSQNYETLSVYVHPEKGVTFTPYSTVDRGSDRVFKPLELSKAKSNTTLYIWGIWDGSGAPIQYTLSEYFSDFVYDADFMSSPILGVNHVLSSGNSLENVTTAYPDASFIEFYLPGVNPDYRGLDWCGLKLVFEQYQGEYLLVGIIHSEWTT